MSIFGINLHLSKLNMPKTIWIIRVAYYALMLSIVALIYLTVDMYNMNYDILIESIVDNLKRPDLSNILRNTHFTAQRFELTRKFLLCFGLILSFLFFLLLFKREYLFGKSEQLMQQAKNSWFKIKVWIKSVTRETKFLLIVLLLFIIVRFIFFNLIYPITYDEAWNYNYFLHSKIYYSLVAYNNYPLHNLICWPIVKIFGSNLIVLRLTSLIFAISTTYLIVFLTYKLGSNRTLAICSGFIFASLPATIFYSLLSRGVVLEVFFSVSVISILTNKFQIRISRRALFCLGILNSLGTFSMLSHGYFIIFSFGALLVYSIAARSLTLFISSIEYLMYSIVFSLILLSPMIFSIGISRGLTASATGGNLLALHDLPFHCYSFFVSGHAFILYFLIVSNLYFIIRPDSHFRILPYINLSLLSATFIIPFITNVYPPERALAFLTVPACLSMTQLLLVLKRKMKIATTLLLTIGFHLTSIDSSYLNWSRSMDNEIKKLSFRLIQLKVHSFYNNQEKSLYYIPLFQYYYTIKNLPFELCSSVKSSSRYCNVIDYSDFDCVVSDTLPTRQFLFLDRIDGVNYYVNNTKVKFKR